MEARTRVLVLLAASAALAGCGAEPADRNPTSRIATDASVADPGAEADTPREQPARTVLRSLRLAHSGWRFDLDAATAGDSIRVDVLARPATVGAAPQRLRLDGSGSLADAFATDLDGDAAPEVLLWLRSAGTSAEAEIRGWRFDPGGEAHPITIPPLDDEAAIGWRGRDQFGVQGGALVRSFPLYRDDDDNAHPSAGFVRVMRYRLDANGLSVAETTLEPMDGTPQADVLAR